jgi:opacity protein-like surface antigen
MMRFLIAAMLILVPVASAVGDEGRDEGVSIQLRIGPRVTTVQAFAPAATGHLAGGAMQRSINGVAAAAHTAASDPGILAGLNVGDDGLALPVSDTVSLGLGYEYLRREDIRLEVAETGSLNEEYSTHNVVLRAHWKF